MACAVYSNNLVDRDLLNLDATIAAKVASIMTGGDFYGSSLMVMQRLICGITP